MEDEKEEKQQRDFDRKIAAIAADQHSLITLSNVIRCGGSRHDAHRRVKAGRWEDCGHCVYRLAGVPWTFEARTLANLLRAGEAARASTLFAARLLGFGFKNSPVEISVPRGRFHRPKGVVVHTSTDLDRCDTVYVDGIPVTDAARTLLDCARVLRSPRVLASFISRARRLGLVTWQDLTACLSKHARPGRPGIRKFRAAIVAGAASEDLTEGDAEYIALSLLREHGFPEPVQQHEVRDADDELAASMDFAYLDVKTNFEIDGPHHREPEQAAKDEARDHFLRTHHGWTVRRIWWRIPIDEPNRFLQIVRNTLRENNHPSFQ